MARLEDFTDGSVVLGIIPHEPVTVVTTRWHGAACLEVFYKTNRGQTGERVIYREDEESMEIVSKSLPWSFDVCGDKMRLVSEHRPWKKGKSYLQQSGNSKVWKQKRFSS